MVSARLPGTPGTARLAAVRTWPRDRHRRRKPRISCRSPSMRTARMPRVVRNRRCRSMPRRNEPAASVAGRATHAGPSNTVSSPCSRHSSARTESLPSSRTYLRMADALNASAVRQSAPRRGQGRATANQTTAQAEHNQRNHPAATRREATMSIRRAVRLHGAAQGGVT
jgi:hypothetical protein